MTLDHTLSAALLAAIVAPVTLPLPSWAKKSDQRRGRLTLEATGRRLAHGACEPAAVSAEILRHAQNLPGRSCKQGAPLVLLLD